MRTFTVILTTGEIIPEASILAAGNGGDTGLSFGFQSPDGVVTWIDDEDIAALLGTADADTIAVRHARAVLADERRQAQITAEVASGRIRELREV